MVASVTAIDLTTDYKQLLTVSNNKIFFRYTLVRDIARTWLRLSHPRRHARVPEVRCGLQPQGPAGVAERRR